MGRGFGKESLKKKTKKREVIHKYELGILFSNITVNPRSLFHPKQEDTQSPWLHRPSELAAGRKGVFKEKTLNVDDFRWTSQEVDFADILPTWRDFLRWAVSGHVSRGFPVPTKVLSWQRLRACKHGGEKERKKKY